MGLNFETEKILYFFVEKRKINKCRIRWGFLLNILNYLSLNVECTFKFGMGQGGYNCVLCFIIT